MSRGKRIDLPNLIGKKYAMLTILEIVHERGSRSQVLCRCECGNLRTVRLSNLRAKDGIYSCGCTTRDKIGRPRVHPVGFSFYKNPTYQAWADMRSVCNSRKHPSFHRYGGAGVIICERWDSFQAFLDDMGERPEGYSLDRIDPMGDFEPGNCHWVPFAEKRRKTFKFVSLFE